MEPEIFTKMFRHLSEKLEAKFPGTALTYFRVKIARIDDARLDFQPFWVSGCLSFSRLDQWFVALVHDVTSAVYANYYAGRHGSAGKNMAKFVAPQKVKPVCKDMLYVRGNVLDSSRKSVKLKQELV